MPLSTCPKHGGEGYGTASAFPSSRSGRMKHISVCAPMEPYLCETWVNPAGIGTRRSARLALVGGSHETSRVPTDMGRRPWPRVTVRFVLIRTGR